MKNKKNMTLIVLFKYLSLVSFILPLTSMAFGNECDDLKDKLKNSISHQVTKKSLEKIAQAKLTVLGEAHYEHYFWKMPHIYRFLKKRNPSINCLFSEIAQDATDKQIQEVINGQKNEIFFTIRRLGFGPLYESIFDLGDDVVLVDVPITERPYKPGEKHVEWVTRRDTWMIKRIEKAFSSNECRSGIYSIGKAHISDFFGNNEPYTSFGTRAKSKFDGVVVVDQVYSKRLNECSRDIPSFVAPSSDPSIREFLGLDIIKSSSDYVLYLREIDVMHALTVED